MKKIKTMKKIIRMIDLPTVLLVGCGIVFFVGAMNLYLLGEVLTGSILLGLCLILFIILIIGIIRVVKGFSNGYGYKHYKD